MTIVLLSFITSFMIVAYLLPKILMLSLRKRLIDPIDPRKVHSAPASRLGGVTFFPAILFSTLLCVSFNEIALLPKCELSAGSGIVLELLGLLSLFMVGVYDDIIGVAYRKKFLVQIFAALIFISSGTYIHTLNGVFGIWDIPMYIGVPITLFFYVFVTNAINLIDGIDGLASLLSIMAIAVYGTLLYINGQINDCIIAAAALGALIPFFFNNVFGIKRGSRSKIFMGDTGALVIGAILGLLVIKVWGISHTKEFMPINNIYYVLAYTMLIIPCFDVARIVLHRYRSHKPLFMPDKNHIHHKFMALGYTPHAALLLIIAFNTLFVVLNAFLSLAINIIYIILIDAVIWSSIHIYITNKANKQKTK